MLSSPLSILASACLFLDTFSSYTQGATLDSRSHRPQHLQNATEPIPPLQDPWYSAPPGFEETRPGAVLRIREAPGNLSSLATDCSAAYNIIYRTTNSRYQPDWAVTTIFVPSEPAPALLSYQIPYDSAFLDASPSYALYGSDGSSNLEDISTGLENGWFVNVPDYEGPLASFTAGVLSGHSTIDSIRAAFNAKHILGLAKDARYAMWGYSGGALASEWAAELQVQYAPEMNFSGAALGGLTPNVTSVFFQINKSISAGLSPASILGLSSQFPEDMDFLISRLKTDGPFNSTGFLATLNYTLSQAIVAYAFQDISEYFIGGVADIQGPIPTQAINRDGIMGYHGVPQMPLFAYKAIADEISAINDTDALVEKYCNIGANILYNRNTVGGHSAESTNGRPAALAWLTSVLNGTYAQDYSATGCTTQVVSVNITTSPLKKRYLEVDDILTTG
ncbi:hypothetical protein N0V93_000669 [Gnomoniopsis smithogilvyi]|uniref:Lipase 1 n=1 Tax=Gnomoniopsis smithogilvyi TaxID=1191159 RepID=A0A9W8Z2A1_9PEZI|nr:hypothetical protein N0V93_000669 [Gnomoniopsis smithogilvyi]